MKNSDTAGTGFSKGENLWKNSHFLKRKALRFCVILLLAFSLIPVFSERTDFTGKIIRNIEFTGLVKLHPDDLYPVLKVQPGQAYDENAVNQDVKNLFATGNFKNIILRVRMVGDSQADIYYDVIEIPRVVDVEFLGNVELFVPDLRTFLEIREGDVFSLQKVKNSVTKLKKEYLDQGFFLSEVWYRTKETKEGIVVTFVIDEGDNIPISKINITGLNHLNVEDIIDIMELKEETSLEEGHFRESKFEEDKFRILGWAKSKGFIDSEIDESGTGYEIRWKNPKDKTKGRVVIVTYKVFEGDIRYFGGYSVEHDIRAINKELNPPERKNIKKEDYNPIYSPQVIQSFLEFRDEHIGNVYDESKYFNDRKGMQDAYRTRGYVFAQIQPEHITFKLTDEVLKKYEACLKSEATNDVDLRCKTEASHLNLKVLRERLEENPAEEGHVLRHTHFTIRENGLAYIESIVVKGMVKTQEKIIRRELLMREGQLYNQFLVDRSREKLINLGFFKEVNLELRPGSDDEKMVLVIDVQEQPTGNISLGGGYGTRTGFSIFTEIGENNLNGTGQRISGRLQYGPTQRSFGVNWSEPWIYERCQNTTGSFWREKMKSFDASPNLESIEKLAGTLQNEYKTIGERIRQYVVDASNDISEEKLDFVKSQIRYLIRDYVAKEEDCYRSAPRPWAFSLSATYSSFLVTPSAANSIRISDDSRDFFEGSNYEVNTFGLGIGISHTFLLHWAHYHQYLPAWSSYAKPTALVNDDVLKRVSLGWQYKSGIKNGIVFDSRDNIRSPTRGMNIDLSIQTVGRILGGQDHYNRYEASYKSYVTWFDYTFGGLIPKHSLKNWKVVQEFRLSGLFMNETTPYKRTQNKDINPYIEANDKLYMGGYETVRGYEFFDNIYPNYWRDGASHMVLGSTEFRFPIAQGMLDFVTFLDGGIMFDNIGEYSETERKAVSSYYDDYYVLRGQVDPVEVNYREHHDSLTGNEYAFGSIVDWNDPKKAVISQRNFAVDRAVYSVGFGIRIQIPVLPLRMFLAQKRVYRDGGLRTIPGDDGYKFVLGISDFRF